jgi:hypothetical protein
MLTEEVLAEYLFEMLSQCLKHLKEDRSGCDALLLGQTELQAARMKHTIALYHAAI